MTVYTGTVATFGGAVGGNTALTSLATTNPHGGTSLNGGPVTTTSGQTYTDGVMLGANATCTSTGGGNITLAGTVDGAFALTVNTAGVTTFGGAIGGTTTLKSVTTGAPGSTFLNGGSVTTISGQTYNGSVTLGANTTCAAGGNINFAGTVDGAFAMTVNCQSGATFGGTVGGNTALTSLTTVAGGGATFLNGGSITTSGGQTYNEHFQLGANTTLSGTTLSMANFAGGGYALTLNNSQSGTLSGVVNGGLTQLIANGAGVLTVTGTITAGAVIVNNPATLGGNGVINAPVTIELGGTLSPGPPIRSMTISNSLTLLGTASMELNATNLANDLVQGLTNIAYGGTLNVVNLGGTLAAGDTFTLFTASNYHGAFGSLQLPSLGSGLTWDTSHLPVNGSIKVVTAPRITGAAKTGVNTFQLSGTGAASQLYYLLASTNLALPLSQWWPLGSTNATAGGALNFVDATATNTYRFYLLSQ